MTPTRRPAEQQPHDAPPHPRLDRKSLEKASGMLGQLAADLGISTQQIRDQARQIIEDE